jgi:predicted nucleotidyltransferase
VRVRPEEIRGFVDAITPVLKGARARLFLFGSRVQDRLKGGDIDLLLLAEDLDAERAVKSEKHRVLAAIHARTGEQKIDLRVSTPAAAKADPFLSTVLPSAILLHEWR